MSRRAGPIALGVLALLLAGLALWAGLAAAGSSDEADRLRAEADQVTARAQELTEGLDLDNTALTDPARTTEVDSAVREILEQVLSYDHSDLDRTARAVTEYLRGPALCTYNALYDEVKRVAGEQRLTLTTEVREVGMTRLEGDRATVLVFVDQHSTRGDRGQTSAAGTQFAITAQHQDGRWTIVEFDLFDQPLTGGQEAPRC